MVYVNVLSSGSWFLLYIFILVYNNLSITLESLITKSVHYYTMRDASKTVTRKCRLPGAWSAVSKTFSRACSDDQIVTICTTLYNECMCLIKYIFCHVAMDYCCTDKNKNRQILTSKNLPIFYFCKNF